MGWFPEQQLKNFQLVKIIEEKMVLAKVQQSAWFPVQPCIEMYISQKFDDQCKFQSHISDFRQRSNFLKFVLIIGDFFALEFRIFL